MAKVVLIFFFAFAALLQAQAAPEFRNYKLNTEGLVDSVVPYDLNGDNIEDIIIQIGKKLNIFLGGAGGTFKQNADQSIQLTEDAFLWCIAKVGNEPSCIVTNGSFGLYIYRQKNAVFASNYEDLIIVPNIFQGNASKSPLYINFMPDINNDGASDALLFDKDTVLIFMQENGEFRLNQKLDIEMDAVMIVSHYPHYPSENLLTVPFFTFGDVNGDKKVDILFYKTETRGERIKIFLQGEGNRFSYKEDLSIKLSEKEKRSKTLFNPEIPPVIEDIDGDGILDIIVPYLKSGRIMVYLIKPDQKNYNTPNYIIETNGWVPAIWVKDFDGDGKKELVISLVEKFGIAGAIEVFLSKKLNVNALTYLFINEGLTKPPSRTLKFSVPFVVNLSRETRLADAYKLSFKPNFDGDFNGDGIKDLIIRPNENAKQLDVYCGNKETILDDKPKTNIKINPPADIDFTETLSTDINRDGIFDCILKYTDIDTISSQIEVVVSSQK